MQSDQRLAQAEPGLRVAGMAFEGLPEGVDRLLVTTEPQINQLAHGVPGPEIAGVDPGCAQEHLEPAVVLIRAQVDRGQYPGRRRVGMQSPRALEIAASRGDLLEAGLGHPADRQGLGLGCAPFLDRGNGPDRVPEPPLLQVGMAARQGLGFRAPPGPERQGRRSAKISVRQRITAESPPPPR